MTAAEVPAGTPGFSPPSHGAASGTAARSQVVVAFAAVYLIWGSTYLGIHYAIQSMPPLLMAAVRFLLAGGVMYLLLRARGAPRPTLREWRGAAVVGTLLLLGGNGALVLAQQTLPSGIAALIVAAVPLWMVLLDWLRPRGTAPGLPAWLGIVLGFAGVAVLVGPANIAGGDPVDPVGAAVLLGGTVSWAVGSVYSRHAPLPASRFTGAAMQMLVGGLALLAASGLRGEWGDFQPEAITAVSLAAFAYLVVAGSLVAFTAYVWLLSATTPAKVSTYAFVNPVVALLLGWAVASEALTARTGVASGLIVAAVALITLAKAKHAAPAPEKPAPVPLGSGK